MSISAVPPIEPSALIAEIAVDGTRAGGTPTLSYAIPAEMAEALEIGQLVWVPLRRQSALGVIVEIHGVRPEYEVREIIAPVEPAFCLNPNQLELVRWMARETACDFYAAAALFLPPGVSHRAVEYLHLAAEPETLTGLTTAQKRVVDLLQARGEVSLEEARKALNSSLVSVLRTLEERGVVRKVVRVADAAIPEAAKDRFVRLLAPDAVIPARAPRQQAAFEYLVTRARLAASSDDGLVLVSEVIARAGVDHATLGALARKGIVEEVSRQRVLREAAPGAPAPSLTPSQARVWGEVEALLTSGDSTPALIHGVTGSGKTEVYLRAVAWVLRSGKSALMLVPEIALASQVVRRFESRFPGRVAVLHSALSDGERYQTWQAVARGERPIVVGPRSALFAPVRNLGLIVLDEEHEGAYKQDAEPRYHTRSLAEQVAKHHGAAILLGSATPSVETTWRASQGEIHRFELPERVPDAAGAALALPPVEIVDLRLELHRGSTSLISAPLQELVAKAMGNGEQAMLLLNRRGTSTVVLCRSCGASVSCPHCDIPLVFHGDRGRLLCHRCNHQELPRQRCELCNGPLSYQGAGTQRIADDAARLFPEARVLRWDQDAVQRQGGHERLLRIVERGEADIVVGTQMIAKGLDLPRVTAIGVINADSMLHLPDFRTAERTFQLLTQVAGRAGRRTAGSGVVVQSYTPGHYAIAAAAGHDYRAFYDEEIAFRRTHRYPPFSRLARFLYRDEDEARCMAEADELARLLARHARQRTVEIDLLGPAPAFASKLRGKFQWQMVLRAEGADFDRLLDDLPRRPGWVVDIDPQSLL